jgi:hypothetical protein
LINCKTSSQNTTEIISLLREGNNLKTLGLVNANIPEASMGILSDLVNESHLRELDISWNPNIRPKAFSPLLEVIG